ncbi:MAG: dihydrofolate reductase [Paludibacteraceae bacterium]|nr:dihydrofolate reductase [Paludibacteraceae bacterium]
MRIAFTTKLPAEGLTRLQGHELYVPLPEADILVSTFDKPVTAAMIASAPKLKLIANFGAGYNNIDLDACRQRGIRVTNTPQPVIEPTAELAFALMIDVARRVSEFDRALRVSGLGIQGLGTLDVHFAVMNNLSHSLYGKTLGIIGMGRIGQSLARRAVAGGMTIVYHNRHRLPETIEARYNARYVTLQTLLQQSDYVSLNLPYTPDVHHMIGKQELAMMKHTAYLINTARGAHVDEQALAEALQTGVIAGAALDVYEHEPRITPELLRLPNVVLSPHTGTGTWEGRIAMCENVADNILAFLNNDIHKMNTIL